MHIDPKDSVSVEIVNKKLEAFVEVVMEKLTEQQEEIARLKMIVKNLSKQTDGTARAL